MISSGATPRTLAACAGWPDQPNQRASRPSRSSAAPMSLTTPCTSGTTFCGSPFISVSRRTLQRPLGPVGGLAAGRGQLELNPAPIGRDRYAPDQPGLLEAIDQRGQRRPAHADRGGQLARALRPVGRRDEQPVLRQADARGLAGLLRHARQAREEPDAFSEIAPGMRHFESVDRGVGDSVAFALTLEPPDQSVQRAHYMLKRCDLTTFQMRKF